MKIINLLFSKDYKSTLSNKKLLTSLSWGIGGGGDTEGTVLEHTASSGASLGDKPKK